MQARIVHDDAAEVRRVGDALARRGFTVATCACQDSAIAFVRGSIVDIVVLKQVIDGRHTTSVALAAEYHSPRVATILLSTRRRAEAVELFELIPSLNAILGPCPDAHVLAALAVQAVRNPSSNLLILSPEERIARPRPQTQVA